MSRTLIIGIDPGASGGFAEIWPDGRIDCFPMFDEPDMRDYLKQIAVHPDLGIENVAVYLEQVGGYVGGDGQPGSSMFKFGSGYGFIRGLLCANHLATTLVVPQRWQRNIPGLKGLKGDPRKRALKNHCARQFPNVKVTLSTCDALLIAAYGKAQQS